MASTKVLLIAQSGIGNFIMQSPVFAALKQHDPGCHVTVLVAPRGTKALAQANLHVDEVTEGSLKADLPTHWRQIRKLRAERFDAGLVLSPGQLWKSALLLKLAGIPVRIGHAYPWPTARPRGLFLTHVVPELASVHDIEQNLALLSPLGITPPATGTVIYTLPLPPSAVKSAEQYLHDHALVGKKLIGFHPGSHVSMPWKRWPKEHFITLGKLLLEHAGQSHLLIFGGPDEQTLATSMAAAIGSRASAVQTDLLTTAAIISRCHLFISNDSGLMHVAAAQHVPTIGLFGPTDERLTGPRGQASMTLRAPATKPLYSTERNATPANAAHSLSQLAPALVFNRVRQLGFDR